MKASNTERNLIKAFVGESQTRNRYNYYSKIARKEGYEQIGDLFEQTANHELSHAKNFFKYLDQTEPIEIIASYPGGRLGTTLENLKQTIEGEWEDFTILYPAFSEEAKREGYLKVAALFNSIAKVEEGHYNRFKAIYERLSIGKWFHREEAIPWMCKKCGYIYVGKIPPEVCPACFHPRAYFEEMATNY